MNTRIMNMLLLSNNMNSQTFSSAISAENRRKNSLGTFKMKQIKQKCEIIKKISQFRSMNESRNSIRVRNTPSNRSYKSTQSPYEVHGKQRSSTKMRITRSPASRTQN